MLYTRVASVRLTNFTLEWIRELTLRYTTPDIRCRHRRHECDGGIKRRQYATTLLRSNTSRLTAAWFCYGLLRGEFNQELSFSQRRFIVFAPSYYVAAEQVRPSWSKGVDCILKSTPLRQTRPRNLLPSRL